MTREEALQILDTIPTISEQVDALEMAIQALSQEPCDDVVSRQAVKVWLEEMDNKLNPRKYNTIAEYYAVKAQMQKLIYICDIPKEKSCLNCKYNNENLYRGEHCGDCDECMLWEQEEQLPSVTQKSGKWIPVSERLPENAKHKGAFCPKYYVMTEFGQTEGWYNPDVGCWYVLLWFMDARFETWNISLERGDVPKLVKNVPVTAWMPLPEPYEPQEGANE